MKYVFVHFGPKGRRVFVDGFLSTLKDDEKILKDIEVKLLKFIYKAEEKGGYESDSDYVNATELLYSIQNPTELNKRGEQLIRIKEFNISSIAVGNWLKDITSGAHLVNL